MLSLLILNHGNFTATRLITSEELLIALKATEGLFCAMSLDEVSHIMRLDDLNEEDSYHMTWMIEETLVIFLDLEDLK